MSATCVERTVAVRRAWSIDAALLLLAILPLLLTAHVPLNDLPNHLARQYILRDWASSPALQSYYTYHWALVPDLALELFVLPLRDIVSIDLAVRLFCIATVAMLCIGTWAVNRSLGGPEAYAYRAAPLLCYGAPFQFGFLSFCFGIGLALLMFAAFLRLRDRPLGVQAAVLLAGGCALMLCHLAAFGVYAAYAGSYELSCALDRKRPVRATIASLWRPALVGVCLLLPPLLFALAGPHGDTAGAVFWWKPLGKLEMIAAIMFFSAPIAELTLLAAAAAWVVVGLAAGALRVHRHAALPLIALAVVTLALPRSGFGGGYVDYRMPWAAAFFVAASLVPGPRPLRLRSTLIAAVIALSVVRIAIIAVSWLRWEPIIAGVDAGMETLPVGARMMVVIGKPESITASYRPPLSHLAAYAVARRQAFEPNMFADLAGHILEFQPSARPHWLSASPTSLDRIDPYYTHLLVFRPSLAHLGAALLARLTPIAQGRDFILYRVEPVPVSG